MLHTEVDFLVADRIWMAVAMLHHENPDREDFSKDEIRKKLGESGLGIGLKSSSVSAHLKQHLVANVPPSTTRKYRMLFQARNGNLRLCRPDDPIDDARRTHQSPKYIPRQDEIPAQYHLLLDWYKKWVKEIPSVSPLNYEDDPLIRLIGSGKHIWADEHADEYVERLRSEGEEDEGGEEE